MPDRTDESVEAKALINKMRREVKRLDNEVDAAHRVVQRMENNALVARKILEQNLAAYANLHFEGATIAAAKGDTRPAEWALTHAKSAGQTTVDPPAKQVGDTGVKVFIGVPMGSMPMQSVSAQIISASDEPHLLPETTNE